MTSIVGRDYMISRGWKSEGYGPNGTAMCTPMTGDACEGAGITKLCTDRSRHHPNSSAAPRSNVNGVATKVLLLIACGHTVGSRRKRCAAAVAGVPTRPIGCSD